MSIDYIKKSLETMRFYEKASISESFSSGGTEFFNVRYLKDSQQFEVKPSSTSKIELFDAIEEASNWIDLRLNSEIRKP